MAAGIRLPYIHTPPKPEMAGKSVRKQTDNITGRGAVTFPEPDREKKRADKAARTRRRDRLF